MSIRTGKSGRRTFGRGDERSRGNVRGNLSDLGELGLAGSDQVLAATDFEGLKLACHTALEELRTRVGQSLSKVGNAVGSGRVPPNRFGGKVVKAAGSPKNNQVAVFLDENRIEGNASLTFDPTTRLATGAGAGIYSDDGLESNNSLTVGSHATVTGSLDVSNTAAFHGISVAVDNTLTVSDTLTVSGTASINGTFNVGAVVAVTLSSGAFTPSSVYSFIESESGTTDDLATINGGTAGDIIIFRPKVSHTITIKHGTGNIETFSAADIDIGLVTNMVTFLFGGSTWRQIAGKST